MKYVRLFEELAQPEYTYYPNGQVRTETWWLNDRQYIPRNQSNY
jgi:hypothetical protein